ncbi:MAG: DsbC family protein [Acinetobacter sp.]|nr:DsbC family protein [Acinetobacter sp.]
MRFLTLPLLAISVSMALTACAKEQPVETTLTASAPAGEASNLTERNVTHRLKATLEQQFKKANIPVKIVDVQEVPNSPFYWVALENHPAVFATADGQYLVQGDVLRLGGSQVEDVSQQFKASINKQALAKLKEQDLIIYPATGAKKHTIYVFSDVSCSYCQRLHRQMGEMNAKGIEVRYVAWPRGEQLFPAMEQIWCSADRKKAFDDVMNGATLNVANCKNPVREQFELGQQMGVSGTPAIFTPEGVQLGGYLSTDDLLKALEQK